MIAGCTSFQGNTDKPVAKVSEKILYRSDIDKIIPHNISEADSALMAEDYIKKWVQNELLIQKARENLSPEQMDVSKEVEDYRNALIIYRYKKEITRQKMDTTVAFEEIEDYYSKNTEYFLLKDNIVKAIFIKIPNEVAKPERLKRYCREYTEEGINELKDYCLQYAKIFDMFGGNWVRFKDVLKHVPLKIENQQRFLSRKKLIELNDDDYYYLIYISEYRLAGQAAPVEYVSGQIKNLILTNRKIELLKNLENEIYEDGVRTNKFSIYN